MFWGRWSRRRRRRRRSSGAVIESNLGAGIRIRCALDCFPTPSHGHGSVRINNSLVRRAQVITPKTSPPLPGEQQKRGGTLETELIQRREQERCQEISDRRRLFHPSDAFCDRDYDGDDDTRDGDGAIGRRAFARAPAMMMKCAKGLGIPSCAVP